MEEASIDLRNNPLVNRFFLGWSTQKAVTFAENLLVIGIGVAKKLLKNNTPEEAYHKLLKMSGKKWITIEERVMDGCADHYFSI